MDTAGASHHPHNELPHDNVPPAGSASDARRPRKRGQGELEAQVAGSGRPPQAQAGRPVTGARRAPATPL